MTTAKGMRRADRTACAALCLLVLISLAFAGCAGNTQVAATDQMQGVERIDGATIELAKKERSLDGVGAYENIRVEPPEASAEFKQAYSLELKMFYAALLNDLRTKRIFKKVLDGTTPAQAGKTVIVSGKIIDMRIASSTARIWGGALAGSSFMDVYIKMTDAATQKTIKEKVIATHNNAFGAAWSGGSSDKTMPVDMGQIVGAYLSAVIPTK